MPEYAGGLDQFYVYISENMNYASEARSKGIAGKVHVKFVVGKDGRIGKTKVLTGIGGGCDEEAERVMRGAPKWKPGKQRGRSVKVRMILPITFKLG